MGTERQRDSLLDFLANEAGCEYLSDLHRLDETQAARIIRVLEAISPGDYSLFQWNDALDYIANIGPMETASDARDKLIAFLKAK